MKAPWIVKIDWKKWENCLFTLGYVGKSIINKIFNQSRVLKVWLLKRVWMSTWIFWICNKIGKRKSQTKEQLTCSCPWKGSNKTRNMIKFGCRHRGRQNELYAITLANCRRKTFILIYIQKELSVCSINSKLLEVRFFYD